MTQAFESGRRFSTCGIRVRPHRSGLPMPIAGRSGLRKPNRVSDGNLSVGRKPNRVSDGDLRSLRRSSLPMPVAGRSLRPSRASLAPCCRRVAILAALGQQGRLPGMVSFLRRAARAGADTRSRESIQIGAGGARQSIGHQNRVGTVERLMLGIRYQSGSRSATNEYPPARMRPQVSGHSRHSVATASRHSGFSSASAFSRALRSAISTSIFALYSFVVRDQEPQRSRSFRASSIDSPRSVSLLGNP